MYNILIVDDCQRQLDLISSYLDFDRFQITTAQDGETGLATAMMIQPDLIITDLVMPNMSGLELCRNLKRNARLKEIPIIVCSSKNRDIDKKWAFKQGASFYLVKPFEREAIQSAVNDFLLGVNVMCEA